MNMKTSYYSVISITIKLDFRFLLGQEDTLKEKIGIHRADLFDGQAWGNVVQGVFIQHAAKGNRIASEDLRVGFHRSVQVRILMLGYFSFGIFGGFPFRKKTRV